MFTPGTPESCKIPADPCSAERPAVPCENGRKVGAGDRRTHPNAPSGPAQTQDEPVPVCQRASWGPARSVAVRCMDDRSLTLAQPERPAAPVLLRDLRSLMFGIFGHRALDRNEQPCFRIIQRRLFDEDHCWSRRHARPAAAFRSPEIRADAGRLQRSDLPQDSPRLRRGWRGRAWARGMTHGQTPAQTRPGAEAPAPAQSAPGHRGGRRRSHAHL